MGTPRRTGFPAVPLTGTRVRSVLPATATRKAIPSPRRRYSRLSLLGSAAAALVAGLGSSYWTTVAGLILAVAGGVLASALAWREVRATRTTLLAQQSTESHQSAELFAEANRRHLRVVSLLGARNAELVNQVGATRSEAARLTQKAAQLRGDKAALQLELNQRSSELAAVRVSLAQVQATLDADIVTLPVRRVTEETALELWTEDGFPTLVQLEALASPPIPEQEQRKHA